MKRWNRHFFIVSILFCWFISNNSILAEAVQSNSVKNKIINGAQSSNTVNIFKVWVVTLNKEISSESLKDYVIVKNQSGKKAIVEVELGADSKSIVIKPPLEGYQYNQKYTLTIKKGLHTKAGTKLKTDVTMNFKTETSSYIAGSGKPNSDIQSYDHSETQNIHEHITEYEQDDSGEITLTLDKKEKELSKLETSDVFVLSPTNEDPMGFIGKVEEVKKGSKGTELKITQPTVEEVFSDLDVDVNRDLSPQDLISTDALDDVSVVYETEELKASTKSVQKKASDSLKLSPSGNFGIEIDNKVIYDHDKDLKKNEKDKNTNGQIILNGDFMLESPSLEVKYKYNKKWTPPFIEFKQLEAKVKGGIHNNIHISSNLDNKFDLAKFNEQQSENKVKLVRKYNIQGVEPDKNTITLASATISAGSVPVTFKKGEPLMVPLGLAVEFNLNAEGEVKAEAYFDISNEYSFEQGFKLKVDGKKISDFTPYNNQDIESSVGLNLTGDYNQQTGVGIDFSLIVGGIIPANITNNLQYENNISGYYDFKAKLKNGDFSINSAGCAEYSNILRLKGEANIRIGLYNDDEKIFEIKDNYGLYNKTLWSDTGGFCVKPSITYEKVKDKKWAYLFDSKNSESKKNVTNYEWAIKKVGEKNVVKKNGAQLEYAFPESGKYEVTLTLTDEINVTGTDKVIIDIKDNSFFQGEGYELGGYPEAIQPTPVNWTRQSSYNGPSKTPKAKTIIKNAYTTPVTDDKGNLYLTGYDDDTEKPSYIIALDSNGKRLWKYSFKSVEDYDFETPVLGKMGVLYVVSNEHLFAFNIKDGTLIWKVKNTVQKQASPSIDGDGTIYVPTVKGLYAYDKLGKQKWYKKIPYLNNAVTISKDETIYVTSGDRYRFDKTYYIYALNKKGGIKQKWAFDSIETPIILGDDGTIYFGTGSYDTSYVYALDSGGREKWKVAKDGYGAFETLVIGKDGTIYAGTKDSLFAISSKGKVKWEFNKKDEEFLADPIISSDGTIYASTIHPVALDEKVPPGYIYAINPDGTKKWSYEKSQEIKEVPLVLGANNTLYTINYGNLIGLSDY